MVRFVELAEDEGVADSRMGMMLSPKKGKRKKRNIRKEKKRERKEKKEKRYPLSLVSFVELAEDEGGG